MIIKKGTKYYQVERELTKEEFDKYKLEVKKQYDMLDNKLANQIQEIQKKTQENKKRIEDELSLLNSL